MRNCWLMCAALSSVFMAGAVGVRRQHLRTFNSCQLATVSANYVTIYSLHRDCLSIPSMSLEVAHG
jgi:hypothetical protein